MRARFHGTELMVNVYGRGSFGYTATNGNIIAVRNGTGWEVVAQVNSHQPFFPAPSFLPGRISEPRR